MIFTATALGLLALGLGLYLIASHYNVTAQLGDLFTQAIAYLESLDHPFAIGLFLIALGVFLLLTGLFMRRSVHRPPPA